MKKHTLCLMGLAGLMTLTTWALPVRAAAEEGGREKPERKMRRAKERPGGKQVNAFKEAGLSEEDIKKVQAISKEHREKAKAAAEANKEKRQGLIEKAKAAKESDDKEALKAVHEEMKKLAEARKTEQDTLQKQIAAAIGEEKAKKLADVMKKRREHTQRQRMLNVLKLTDEQKAKLVEAEKKAAAADSPEAKHKIMKEALAGILTDEQKEKFKKMTSRRPNRPKGRRGPLRNIELTDEQKAKLAEAEKKATAADSPEARRKIRMEALDNILTDEQKEKMKEARKGREREGRRPRKAKRGESKPSESKEGAAE